ncbi:MAG: hypothetical protein WB558_02625 [Terriglobales bacterium]
MPKLYSVKRPPASGELGDVYFSTETKQFFVCLAGGELFDMAGLLTMQPQPVVGPQGPQGSVGPPGPRGLQGAEGIQGRPGVSGSMGPAGHNGSAGLPGATGKTGAQGPQGPQGTAGKDGASIVGPAGPQGPRGDVMIPNADELSAAVIAYRQKFTAIQAALLSEIGRAGSLPKSTNLHVKRILNNVKKAAGL